MPSHFKKEYLWVVCILSVLLMFAFFDVVFLGKTFKVTTANSQALPNGVYGQSHNKPKFIPVNGTDAPVLEEPVYEFIKRNLQQGILPLWNPHQACGYPLIGMIQVGLFFPLNFILYLLPELFSWDILILSRLLLAGLFVYWLMRTLKFSKIPALASGIAFMLSGPMVLLQYWTANVDMLAPLLLIATDYLIRKTKAHHLAFLSLGVALTIFAGHPEHIFLVNVYCVCFFLFRLICLRKEVNWQKASIYFVFAYVLGACLSAIVLFPFVKNLLFEFWHAHPPRVGLLMEENRSRAITLALPHFFQKAALTYQFVFAGWWGGYLGTIPLGLAFLSLFNKTKDKLNYFFAALAFIIIGKEYGLPIINWIGYLPIFDMCRYAIHSPALAALSIAILAGMGIQAILNTENIFRKGLIFSIGLLLIADIHLMVMHSPQTFNIAPEFFKNVPFSLPLKATLFAFALLVIFQTILWLKDKKLITKNTISILLVVILFAELFLYVHRERPQRFRSFAKVPYIELLKTSREKIRNYGNFWAFYPNTATGFGVDDLGYFFGLVPKRFVKFINTLVLKDYFKDNLNPPALRAIPIQQREDILDMLNVKHIIIPADDKLIRAFPHFKDAQKEMNLVYQNEVRIFERPNTFPRAFIVHRAFFQPDETTSLSLVHKIGAQLRDVAVINHPVVPKIVAYLRTTPARDSSTVKITKYSANEVVLDADMEHGGFVVLSEAFHPDWRATLDGKGWKIFQTNYLLRSVFVPPGQHQIKMIFKPMSFYWGAFVSFLGFLAFFALLFVPYFRKKSE